MTGEYYFALQFAPDNAPPDADAPPLGAAIQKLGLKLERSKEPLEMLVIGRIEKVPTDN